MSRELFERVGFHCTLRSAIAILLISITIDLPRAQAEKACVVATTVMDKYADPLYAVAKCDCLPVPVPTPTPIPTPLPTPIPVIISTQLPTTAVTTATSLTRSSCSTCGPSAVPTVVSRNLQIPVVADQVDRVWIPNDRSSNSSFSPGFFSPYDSQMDLFTSGSGTTIVFTNVLQQRNATFVDGINGDSLDGIFHDLKNESARQIELQNASGTVVTSLSSATKVVVKYWMGETETYEIIDLDPSPTAIDYAARLVKRTNRDARDLVVNYASWTATELSQSPSRQWQISTITDSFGNQLTFTYSTTQYSGRWCVSNVARNDGRSVAMSYANNALSAVTFADGSQTTFTYSQDTPNNMTLVTVKDVTNAIMTGVFHLANDYANSSSGNQVNFAVPGQLMQHDNGSSELKWQRVLPTNSANDQIMIVSEGRALVQYGDGTRQGVSTYSGINNQSQGVGIPRPKGGYYYVTASYTPVNTGGFVGYNVTLNSLVYGASATSSQLDAMRVPSYTDVNGRNKTYSYTADGDVSQVNYTGDSTFEAYSYNSFRQKTRERSRSGNVQLHTYDSQGHKLSTSVGLIEQSGQDVQTAAYATTTYAYYGSTHVNAGMLQTEFGPLYSASSPNLHRTDYQYDSQNRITKITGPAAVVSGSRPETNRTYNSNGLLASETSPTGYTTSFTYDSMGRLTQTTYPDGSIDQQLYGAAGTTDVGRLIKTKDRANVVTTYAYDAAGRVTTQTVSSAIDTNILDGQADTNPITDPSQKQVIQYVYQAGSDTLKSQMVVNGAKTDYVYDSQYRMTEVKQYPRTSVTLSSKKGYQGDELLYDEDPYGRRKYYGYRASDGMLIRTVQCNVPETTLADFNAVWNQTRNSSPNATYVINDAIRDSDGNLTQMIDGRGTETRKEYDSVGREINSRVAFGTSLEARTETVYDLAGRVVESRTPRYFDSSDTNGFQKSRTQWTIDGRGQIVSRTVAPGTAEAGTESYTYDLAGHVTTRTDAAGNVWTQLEDSCCEKQTASVDPLGHGTIKNTDSLGRTVHTIQVSDVSTMVGSFANPTDAKTLAESTTKYDSLGRPIYQTSWLVARGAVDPANPPIAGLNGVSASDGLTTQYLYDNNLADGVGLDSASGLSVPKLGTGSSGTTTISLSTVLSKLADLQSNGGASTSFSTSSGAIGSATVVVNAEDEISFSINDSAGRPVMTGKLVNYRGSSQQPPLTANSLASWSCAAYDSTTNLSGYGTLVITKSIDALGYAKQIWKDGSGRALRSVDQLNNTSTKTFDAGGSILSARDANSVGEDNVYDALGRKTQRTDTFGDVTKTEFNSEGNPVKQIDAKNKYTTIAFDARGRRKSVTDRLTGVTTYTYTAIDLLASLTDAENQTTSYTYDTRGLKVSEQYPDHVSGATVGNAGYGIVTMVLDNAGQLIQKQDQAGDTCTYTYDLAGRQTKRDYRTAANSPSGTISDSDTLTLDRASRITSAVSGRYSNTVGSSYDPSGRKASESLTILGQTYTVGLSYNARDEVTKYTYPDSSISDRSYYATGNLNQLKLDSSVVSTRSYDGGGRMTSEALGNGITETRAYRTDNLISTISYSNTNIGDLTYSWDANKNKTGEAITGAMSGYGFASAATAYDFEDRLTALQQSSGNYSQSWTLTSVGDWSSTTINGTASSRTHGPAHELLTNAGQSVSTDVKGNTTAIPINLRPSGASTAMNLTWDFDNRMKSADVDANGTADVSYQYDALGRRVARVGSTTTVYCQVDQQTIADYVGGDVATNPQYRYVYAAYVDEPVVRKTVGTSGTKLYYHRNQQYSIYAITDASGNVSERMAYTAYGQPVILNASAVVQSSSAVDNRFGFTSREWDGSVGSHYFRTRWMNSLVGRFLSRDGAGYVDGSSLYASYFVPSKVDPDGEITVTPVAQYLPQKCGTGQPWIRWTFKLDKKAPCDGFVVQQVDVRCKINSCKDCPNSSPVKPDFTYWEAWEYKKGQDVDVDFGKFGYTDELKVPTGFADGTCGNYSQIGTIKFFCTTTSGDLNKNWKAGGTYGAGMCSTSVGDLRSTGTLPAFWGKAAQEGPASRSGSAYWNCCPCATKFAMSFGSPTK